MTWIWVVFLSVWVDVLLLLGANRLAGYGPGWKQVVPAACIDGVYSGLCLRPGFSFLGNWWWRFLFLVLVAMMAFGWGQWAWKRWGIFALLQLALSGILVRLEDRNLLGLLVAALLIWILCRFAFGGHVGGRKFVPLEIRTGDVLLALTALQDTGNMLRDPVTGEGVLVVDSEAGEMLTGLSPSQLANPLENLGAVQGLRLIPFRTVGTAGGFLLAKRYNTVKVGNWRGSALVAFAPYVIGRGAGYRALTGGMTV